MGITVSTKRWWIGGEIPVFADQRFGAMPLRGIAPYERCRVIMADAIAGVLRAVRRL
jgi:hypothetical protein